MTTAILRDDLFLAHDTGAGHPENAQRLAVIHRSLDRQAIPGTFLARPRAATRAEVLRIHDAAHVEAMARTADRGAAWLDADTRTSPRSYEAALGAAGATLQGVEMVVKGEAQGAFALVRPPGHHAEQGHAKGFCLFNNVAIAAAHAIEELGCRRVLVVDPDVHHGNGTQHSFWERDDVLYVSSHRYPFFPGTGAINEIGAGPGRGHTINMPLRAGTGDADFLHLYTTIIDPVVQEYHPELILVSAGFDTWYADPLGGMRQTREGFRALYALFRRWADGHCPGRIVLTLEGGYDPEGLVVGVRTALEVLTAPAAPAVAVEGHVTDHADRLAYALWRELTPTWHGLARVRV